ncbi:unnamed protein product [Amoebophrya sp. A25]|nr:unnamed protein product [Amoebophrya sp. A25]|eukprot:GSA25T00011841001.1
MLRKRCKDEQESNAFSFNVYLCVNVYKMTLLPLVSPTRMCCDFVLSVLPQSYDLASVTIPYALVLDEAILIEKEAAAHTMA